MFNKLVLVLAFAFFGTSSLTDGIGGATASKQDVLEAFKGNNCVTCHARVMNPLRLTSRYAQWHMSTHRDKAVGCEKCHGGDPGIDDAKKAHAGVLPITDAASKLYPKNVPATCSTCHESIANSFTASKHYQNLKSAGLGPSCNTCHAHMASEVIYTGEQTATLCSTCHDSSNALMPKRPEIPTKGSETVEAIRRAKFVVDWAGRLLEQAEGKKLDVGDAQKELKSAQATLSEAKITWHTFNLDQVRQKADSAFEAGTKLKDKLRSKLFP
jgi:ssDNA-binding Zn-finger/Zn-ribbon topoisomerase 1